jgi:hypothetical protein
MCLEAFAHRDLGFVRVERAHTASGDILVGFANHVLELAKSALTLLQGVDRLAKNVVFRLEQSGFDLSPDPVFNI